LTDEFSIIEQCALPPASLQLRLGNGEDVSAILVPQRDMDMPAAPWQIRPRFCHETWHDTKPHTYTLSHELEERGIVRDAIRSGIGLSGNFL
jgi:hypothetical protein